MTIRIQPLTNLSKLLGGTEEEESRKRWIKCMIFGSLRRKMVHFMNKQSLPLEDLVKQSASSLCNNSGTTLLPGKVEESLATCGGRAGCCRRCSRTTIRRMC